MHAHTRIHTYFSCLLKTKTMYIKLCKITKHSLVCSDKDDNLEKKEKRKKKCDLTFGQSNKMIPVIGTHRFLSENKKKNVFRGNFFIFTLLILF